MRHLLSVDLEDWFHLLGVDETAREADWKDRVSRVERVTLQLLDFFDKHQVKATFFVLGWVAEHFPDLIKEIAQRGHHLGCHSFAHGLICHMSPVDFERDLERALQAIERACGQRVNSFRAPGFSITPSSLWAFGVLAKQGIRYDSSVFPAQHAHGGLPEAPQRPHRIQTAHGELREFPISTLSVKSKAFVFSGGGYFRLLPLSVHRLLWRRFERKNRPVITYLHPRDFDTGQPVIQLNRVRQFKSYVNISHTFYKLDVLLKAHRFGTLLEVNQQIDWTRTALIYTD